MCALLVYRTSHITNHNAEYRLRVYFKTGRATSSLQINAGTHSSDAATTKFILIRRRDVNGSLIMIRSFHRAGFIESLKILTMIMLRVT